MWVLLQVYSEGDIIKSFATFATFYVGYGWFGILDVLTPGMGYKLRVDVGGDATFAVLSSPSPPCGLVELSGYSCASNSASFAVNQQYQQEGSTADGRPYFHGVQDEAVYLYYTTMCGGISGIDGWGVFDSAPSLDATSNVNAGSGGCSAATFLIWPGANFPQASTMGWYTYCRPPSETWSSSWYVQQDHFVATLSVCL